MEDSENAMSNLQGLRSQVADKISFLLDNNARAVVVLRNEAKAWEQIAQFYIEQADAALDLSGLIAEIALETSKITGDILIAEFGSVDEETSEADSNHREDDTEWEA